MKTVKPPLGIIFIESDQHRFDCMGLTGHPLVKTPNMDRLAAEGIFFKNAYTPTPICVPTRTSYLCGQWPQEHGTICNFDGECFKALNPERTVFPRVLSEIGMNLDFFGRWHVNNQLDPITYGFTTFLSDSAYWKWREEKGLLRPVTQEGGSSKWFGMVDNYIKPEDSRLSWLCGNVIEKLRERVQDSKPFYISMDTWEPHLPNIVPEPYNSMYPPEDIPPWGSFRETFKNKPYIQEQQLRTWGIENWTWKEWAPIVSRYLGEISLLDAQIGRILDELDNLGIADDVLVIYTADHGDMCGGHRMIDKHYIMYEDVCRVPLIMRWPNGIKPGSRHEGFVSNSIDLPITYLDIFNLEKPESFSGLSLLPAMFGDKKPVRKDIFCSWNGNQFGQFSQRMVFDGKWKYIWNATDRDELYNLEDDPFELENLASNSSSSCEISIMRKRLLEWMKKTGDKLLNDWIKNQLLEGRKL
jgi:arylsulfatase A-like enzyme